MIWKKKPSDWSKRSSEEKKPTDSDEHLHQAKDVLQGLLNDERLPNQSKQRLSEEFRQLNRYLKKLKNEHIYVAAFGRVSVGKSALLNALIGSPVFSVSVLHGKTKQSEESLWQEFDSGGVYLIDTPGIDEIDGQERALIAEKVAKQADLILFVIDGDLTDIEFQALTQLHQNTQPMLLVLNKADQYYKEERAGLLRHLEDRVQDYISKDNIFSATAIETRTLSIQENEDGSEKEIWHNNPIEIDALKNRLWQIIKSQGKSYAALNAAVFAEQISEKVSQEIISAKKEIADKIIRHYALVKAIAVAVNPIPLVDLLALAADAGMIYHLSRVYGINFTKRESTKLISSIAMQTGLLMTAVYGTQFLSSALKGLSFGLSTVITATAQAGVAFYGSYVIGKAAERYFMQGASWGEKSAKEVINEIISDLDKQTLMQEAKSSINQILRKDDGKK